MDQVTQEVLEATCLEWQKRLRLQDWQVTVRLRDWVEMSVFGQSGECQWNLQQKSATIDILRSSQRCDDSDLMTKGGCWEQTLVHELLHLHFAPFHAESDTLEQTAQEQSINGIAAALMGLEREAAMARDYGSEYKKFHGKPEEVAKRASRNAARAILTKKHGKDAISKMDASHKDNNPLNNDPKNLKPETPSANRSRKTKGK